MGFTRRELEPAREDSVHQATLDEDLPLPERHGVTILGLLLVAHVTVHLGFEVESEREGISKRVLLNYSSQVQLT